MLSSFPNLRIGVMVGIGDGAPSPKHDILLGDIVVSAPRNGRSGVLAYNFGEAIQDEQFQMTAFLNQPPTVKDLYDRHKQNQTRLPVNDILETLHSVSVMYSKVFILVDALDECQTSANCLQQFLSHIFGLRTNSATSFLATPRHIPAISKESRNFPRQEILANSENVHKYLYGHMSDLLNFVTKRPDIQEEIAINIAQASGGIMSFKDSVKVNVLVC